VCCAVLYAASAPTGEKGGMASSGCQAAVLPFDTSHRNIPRLHCWALQARKAVKKSTIVQRITFTEGEQQRRHQQPAGNEERGAAATEEGGKGRCAFVGHYGSPLVATACSPCCTKLCAFVLVLKPNTYLPECPLLPTSPAPTSASSNLTQPIPACSDQACCGVGSGAAEGDHRAAGAGVHGAQVPGSCMQCSMQCSAVQCCAACCVVLCAGLHAVLCDCAALCSPLLMRFCLLQTDPPAMHDASIRHARYAVPCPARRALDYLYGFNLSPLLWRKVPGARSAGRVQSVALRLVCEREAAIEAFVPQQYFTVGADLALPGGGTLEVSSELAPGGAPRVGADMELVYEPCSLETRTLLHYWGVRCIAPALVGGQVLAKVAGSCHFHLTWAFLPFPANLPVFGPPWPAPFAHLHCRRGCPL